MARKAVIFDLDGVLVDLCDVHRECFVAAFNECATMDVGGAAAPSTPLTLAVHAQHLEGLSSRSKLAKLRALNLVRGATWSDDAVFAAKQRLIQERLASYKYPTLAREALAWAKAQGLKVAVYTSSIRATLDVVLAGLGLGPDSGLVDVAVSDSDPDVPTPKPSPAGYQLVLRKLAVSPDEAVIFEDSPVGLQAARGSGAAVVPVLDSLDMTPAFLQAAVEAGKPPSIGAKLRIVVPMAGLGSRFQKDGFVIQKPFLPTIGGRQLWEVVVENLMPKDEPLRSATEVHLVVREEQRGNFRTPPHVHLHTVPGLTEGAACTVLTLKDIINDDVPLMIGNSDQFLEWDADAFYRAAFHPSYDGAISTFYHPRPDDLKWSYASLNEDGTVANVAEKVYVGPHATTGLYAWKRGSDYVRYAEKMIAANIRVNNEFYVCPVYNGALKAGAKIRIVNCAAFWGVGVPDDYYAWLDRYTPPGPALPFHAALARKYAGIWCKWGSRLPVPQPDVASDPSLCACMWTTGAMHLTPAYYELKAALAPWADKFQWFDQQAGLGLMSQGPGCVDDVTNAGETVTAPPKAVLHHTFFQFRTFTIPPAELEQHKPALALWAEAAQGAMAKMPPYYVRLTGVCPVRSGVVACGFPPTDYTPVRTAIRGASPCREPHAQDIHHVTLLRWTAPLRADEYTAVCAVLERFRDAQLGMVQPTAWHVGFASWCVRPETVIPVHSWRATPSPWVLHRGNSAGLAPATENEPGLLRERLAAGWDIEIDLWRLTGAEAVARANAAAAEGKGPGKAAAEAVAARVAATPNGEAALGLWLGHDAPTYALGAADEAELLSAPGVWVHCKNLGAFAYLRGPAAAARGVKANFFSHDVDPVALTSAGYAWGFPGVAVDGPGTVSVVWPKERTIKAAPGVGICHDYFPWDDKIEHAEPPALKARDTW